MQTFKLLILPVAIFATSIANAGVVKNATEQMTDGVKNIFKTATHPAAISAEVGTLGYGGNIGWSVNEKTELVAGWTGGRLDGDVDINIKKDNDKDKFIVINWHKLLGDGFENFKGNLDYKFKLNNPYLGVQMRPFGNALTVGTGVMFPQNEAKLGLSSDDSTYEMSFDGKTYKINDGKTYKINDGKAKIDVAVKNGNDIAPYLTLGFRPNSNKRWGLYGEVGASYMGKSKSNVKVVAPNITVTDKDGNMVTQLADQTAKDLEKDIQNKISQKNMWYPVAKLGLTVRF